MAGISEGALITDPTFIREQWSGSNADIGFPESLPPAAGSVVSINGTPGPVVDFSGGTTGLTFSSGATPITLSGTLVVGDGGTGKTTLTNHGVLVGAAASAINVTSAGTAGQILTSNGAGADPTFQAAATSGTVTSFSATPSSIFDVATATTTPALSLDNQSANTGLFGPTTGAVATPAFRALVNADLPNAAWVTYSPTWTNLTVGNGTVTAKYATLPNKVIVVRVEFVMGNTSAVTGDIQFDLPVASVSYAGTSSIPQLGDGSAYDSGTAVYAASVQWVSTTVVKFRVYDSSGAYLARAVTSAIVPFVWTTGDEVDCQFIYEAA